MFLPNKVHLAARRGYLAPPVVIILALITIAVAATLILQAKFFSKDKTPSLAPVAQASVQPSTKTQASPPPQSTTDEMADWKTFNEGPRTDKFINATFKYPSEWVQLSSATDNDSCNAFSVGPSDSKDFCGSNHFPQIYIKPLTAGDAVRCKETKKTVVNSYEAIYCTDVLTSEYKNTIYVTPKNTKITDYFFADKGIGNKGVAVWYTQELGWPNREKEFNQILSTFQFIE